MERKKVFSLLCAGFILFGNLVAPVTNARAETTNPSGSNVLAETNTIDPNGEVIDSISEENFVVPETEEPEAEVFVEPETYDLSTMKLKNREIGVVEDGGAVENDLFEFEAFIKESNIKDGTAPFDGNDDVGNDSSPNNGIVRTFDTVVYPLTITINPKKTSELKNIIVRVTGYLDGGFTEGRVNASFPLGEKIDIENKVISFSQEYNIPNTGNSVMLPLAVDVKGASNGTEIKPYFKVQVMSVDGVSVEDDKIITEFNQIPKVKASGMVSLYPYMSFGFAGYGIDSFPYSGITGDVTDTRNTQAVGVSFGLNYVRGRRNFKGATFPSGKVNFELDFSGSVYWDGGPLAGHSEPLNFEGRDSAIKLYDHHPIEEWSGTRTGKLNTELEGKSYVFKYPTAFESPMSSLPTLNESNINDRWWRSVWDSGKWHVEKPEVSKNHVVYEGNNSDYMIGSTFPIYRADGFRGYPIYSENDRVFTSNAFNYIMPNEYMIGSKNNPNGYANNVYYNVKVNIKSYEDENGTSIPLSASTSLNHFERNNPEGAYSVQTTIADYPSGEQLGTPNSSWPTVSRGDVSTILGSDVLYNAQLGSSMISRGGHDGVFQWNTDSFELTKEYAIEAEDTIYETGYLTPTMDRIKNERETQFLFYGVPNFTDNSFGSFSKRGRDDYTWYDSYDKAKVKGEIGALMHSVYAPTGATWLYTGYFPLKVKTKKIGSVNEKDTTNMIMTNYYPYVESRQMGSIDVYQNNRPKSPSIWGTDGKLISIQKGVGSTVNFETLAVLSAEASSSINADKNTYYNSEEVNWKIDSSIILPASGIPEGYDTSVKVQQILPVGLDYKFNSGKQSGINKEPKITKNPEGSTTLTWDLLISGKDNEIDGITYVTTINPLALSNGVQNSLTVKNIISSDLDTRSENLRTSTKDITILKVGMVGIYENIDVDNGEKNSSFTVRMKPYTTIEDELDVKGLTVIPLSGDKLGSVYQGSAVLEGVEVTSKKPVSIYLNNSIVESNKPNQIDLTKNGWYKYTGKDQDISKALSLLFHVEGVLANTDDVEVAFTVKTKDNNFGNIYYNETVINSATDYKLSPISNKVKYTIRADVELNVERIQIYTAKASEKLPVNLRVNKEILKDRSLNEPLKLVLYDKEKNTKVYEKSLTIATLTRENELEVPARYLEKNTNRTYEARIEGYNTDRIYVKEEADKIDTLGYTASEKTLEKQAVNNTSIEYKGVIMTERVLGKEIEMYYETINLPIKQLSPIKAGYGFSLDQQLDYTNDLTTKDVTLPKMAVIADSKVVDGDFYNSNNGKSTIELLEKSSYVGNKITQTYSFPEVYVKSGSGDILSQEQYQSSEDISNIVSGGNKVYVPIWIEELGKYDISFKNTSPIGVNEVNVIATDTVKVEAFMYGHIGSETIEKDEILITPIDLKNLFSGNLPKGWTELDVDWLQDN